MSLLKFGNLPERNKRGATWSKLILVNDNGDVIAERASEGLNYHLIGVEKAADRVASLVLTALAETCNGKKLTALGLAFSGAKDGSIQNNELLHVFRKKYPDVSEHIYIVSDTLGTLQATLPKGGAVIISGTGSSCFLKVNGYSCHCGGNGHLIGDKGSGFWIALRAIKYVVNEQTGWKTPPYNSATVRSLMHKYFAIEEDLEILHHLYKSFSKPKISGFCAELSKHGTDKLSAAVFNEAGILLGRHINLVVRNAEQHGRKIDSLEVIAVGSVFNSWPLLKDGFIEGVRGKDGLVNLSTLTIYTVKGTIAKGLAYMAAREAGYSFHYDFTASKNLVYVCNFQSKNN